MAFYWVNLGDSRKEVRDYNFLWAPTHTVNKSGSRTVNAGWRHVPKVAKGDITSPSLRAAIDKAKAENMPKDTIDRAVKKGISNISYTEIMGDGVEEGDTVISDYLNDEENGKKK